MSFQRGLLCAALLAAWPAAQARTLGTLEFEPCTLAPEFSPISVEAQCATLSVPENRDAPDARAIELAIAWVPTDNDDAPDPVFMLAGGPGQSARESYPSVSAAFRDIRRKRHVILVDQRGTGASNALVCRDAEGKNAFTESDDDNAAAAAEFARKCAARLADQADPRFYTTTDAIQDLDAVRAAIGAAQINLVGISYGTRVAQQYARRYPAQTRSLILDGVVPNELMLGSEHAKNLEAALDLHFARCAEDTLCAEKLGSPRANLDQLATELRSHKREVSFRDAFTGERKQGELGYGQLAAVVRLYTYAPTIAAMLPLSLHEAAQGRSDALMAQANMLIGQVSEQITHGMQLSVMCAEDAAGLKPDPADVGTVLGTEFITFSQAQCAAWPTGAMPADFHAPLQSTVPTLLLSGEFDPVTPPRYGEQVVKGLSAGRHLVLAGQGHNVIGVGCAPKLAARFIDTADASKLETECLDALSAPPPFAGFYGWEP